MLYILSFLSLTSEPRRIDLRATDIRVCSLFVTVTGEGWNYSYVIVNKQVKCNILIVFAIDIQVSLSKKEPG